MAATGEKTWSSEGKTITKNEFKLIPKGEYTFKLQTAKANVGKSENPDSAPYVKGVSIKLQEDVGPGVSQMVFVNVFVSLKPSAKDGKTMVERSNGLLALARALGQETPDFTILTMQDSDGNEIEYLNPTQVADWLKSLDGSALQANIKVEKGRDGYADKNAVAFFVEADA